MAPFLVAAVIALLLIAGDGAKGTPEQVPRDASAFESRNDRLAASVDACDLLSKTQARAALGRIRPKPVKRRLAADNDACAYYKPGNRALVTVGLYPAESFERTVAVLPRVKRDTVVGRRAAYDRRLGYLIELPGRPYYMQVTYFHVVHTHADRLASKRLARSVLTGQTTPAARFICSLTGERA